MLLLTLRYCFYLSYKFEWSVLIQMFQLLPPTLYIPKQVWIQFLSCYCTQNIPQGADSQPTERPNWIKTKGKHWLYRHKVQNWINTPTPPHPPLPPSTARVGRLNTYARTSSLNTHIREMKTEGHGRIYCTAQGRRLMQSSKLREPVMPANVKEKTDSWSFIISKTEFLVIIWCIVDFFMKEICPFCCFFPATSANLIFIS